MRFARRVRRIATPPPGFLRAFHFRRSQLLHCAPAILQRQQRAFEDTRFLSIYADSQREPCFAILFLRHRSDTPV